MSGKIACPECGKRLADRNGVYTHLKAKHGGKGKGAYAPQYEPSHADEMIERAQRHDASAETKAPLESRGEL